MVKECTDIKLQAGCKSYKDDTHDVQYLLNVRTLNISTLGHEIHTLIKPCKLCVSYRGAARERLREMLCYGCRLVIKDMVGCHRLVHLIYVTLFLYLAMLCE